MSAIRERQPWEAMVVSACISIVSIVVTVLCIIMLVYLAMFGVATLRAHWPQ